MQYAMVENGKIVNVALWDGEIKWSLDDGVTVINIDDISPQPGIGWSFDGANFTAPPTPELTKEEYIALADSIKTGLIASAQTVISIWQSELLLVIISDDNKISLTRWINYINEFNSLDFSPITDQASYDSFSWPVAPEESS
ncbi:tail fiber assembly protein [Enterobacter kobei]|uniref:tail fiber assembly protein n=1 Tax=Enterobacter kobei TaxID=208224 RepID=UPI000E2ED52D|nr:tail fiber assembly protein [Enterobacter kobei]ELE9682649.1 tail fiber assembly protein [Enterobacter kobei]